MTELDVFATNLLDLTKRVDLLENYIISSLENICNKLDDIAKAEITTRSRIGVQVELLDKSISEMRADLTSYIRSTKQNGNAGARIQHLEHKFCKRLAGVWFTMSLITVGFIVAFLSHLYS